MVGELVRQLKADGVGIFLITHDMPDVFGCRDRLAVMKNGSWSAPTARADVTEDEVLGHDHRGQEGDAGGGGARSRVTLALNRGAIARMYWS